MVFFKGWKSTELLWAAFGIAIISWAGLGGDPLEYAAGITNFLCVILVAKGRVSNYYWGLAGVLIYGYVSWLAGFYGNMALNLLYYAPMQFVGWWNWRKNQTAADVTVRYLSVKGQWGVGIGATVLVFCLYGYFGMATDNTSPFLDSFTTVLSAVAMVLMVTRYAEQWILWVLVNIASIVMWAIPAMSTSSGSAIVAMWFVFLINSLYGFYKWYYVRVNK